jgi:type III secretion protein C
MNVINNVTTPSSTDVPFKSGFDLGVIGDIIRHNGQAFLSLGSLMQALQQDNETTIVTTPKIITQDGKTSRVFIGKNIPFVGSQVMNNSGSNNVNTVSLEYRDIGMNMTITPFLGNSDVISLAIDLENSATIGSTQFSNSDVTGITTSKTTMNTTVMIPNKNFLILSGMVTENHVRTKSGIPCLGGIPWLGAAFSTSSNSDTKDNLVIFIRPHIINSFKDLLNITEGQEQLFRENTGSPGLEQDFDESTELIKSFDDE